MSDNEMSKAEIDAILGTTVKNVTSMPAEGLAEYEISDFRFFEPGEWDNDDVYQVMAIILRNCEDETANAAQMKVRLYADKDPKTNDWVRDENGNVIIRGLEKASKNSNWGKLIRAVFPDEKKAVGASAGQLLGKRIKCNIAYKVSPQGKEYAEVNPRPL